MIVFPNAKINLGLSVTGKRPDGFHNIETVFYPVACSDVLEAVPSENFKFSCSGIPIEGPEENNLCIKAYRLLQKDFSLPALAMHLHKILPMGAGLGGGSSDGAFTLLLLNKLFNLQLSERQLLDYALLLGSDCPFFILNKPAFASGRGEILEPLAIPQLTGKKFLLVNPGIEISTRRIFEQLPPESLHTGLPDLIRLPITAWKQQLFNVFEPIVLSDYPELVQVKKALYEAGAFYAAMSGTGSTFYGIFDEIPTTIARNFKASYRIMPC